MKPAHLNLLLLAVAAGLFTLLAIDERQEKAAIAKAIERQPPLTALDANAIQRIRLRNTGSPDIVLEKTGSGWQLREPVALPADLVQIGNLTALVALETRGSLDGTLAKRADLGLDPPRSAITYDALPLGIGEIEPLKRSRYVELNPGTPEASIRLVDDFALEPFDGDFTDLVNKALLPFDATITGLELPGLRLSHDDRDCGWTAIPRSDAASPVAIQALTEAWRDVRALATLPPLADGTDDQLPSVTVRLADGTTLRYRVVDRGGSRYLQRRDVPVSYQLRPQDADRLLKLLPPSPAAP